VRFATIAGVWLCVCLASAVRGADDDLVFIHHSCGQNWLDNSLHTALADKDYIDERNDIYYGVDVTPDTGRPDSLGGTPGDSTDMNHWLMWFNDYLTNVTAHGCADGANRIIMFKSCYPNSAVWGEGTAPGDPFSSSFTIANLKAVYSNANAVDGTYTNGGYVYKPLEQVFSEHPEILFIPVTAPPLHECQTSADDAARARAFNHWLVHDWLSSYNANHPGFNNVAVYNWFGVLAFPSNSPQFPNQLRTNYAPSYCDSHPNSTANATSTYLFATGPTNFIDAAWSAFYDQDVDTDGMPDRWERVFFDSLTNMNASTDSDDDGMLDADEYLAGTGPTNDLERLIMSNAVTSASGQWVVSWQSVTTRVYTLERSTNLTAGFATCAWDIHGCELTTRYTDTVSAVGAAYRVLTAPKDR
jgi:hypothetical protein